MFHCCCFPFFHDPIWSWFQWMFRWMFRSLVYTCIITTYISWPFILLLFLSLLFFKEKFLQKKHTFITIQREAKERKREEKSSRYYSYNKKNVLLRKERKCWNSKSLFKRISLSIVFSTHKRSIFLWITVYSG